MKCAVAAPDDLKPRLNYSAGLLVHGTFDAKEVAADGRWLEPGARVEKPNLFLDCLRRTVDVYRHGTFNRWETVASMATCIDIHMRQVPADDKTSPEFRDAGAVPRLELAEPPTADDQVLQELYAEAVAFWAAGYGKLRLIK